MPGEANLLKILFTTCLALLMILYPVCVYFGLQYFDPRHLVIGLVLLFMARILIQARQGVNHLKPLMAAILVFAVIVIITNSQLNLKFYPVVISLVLLSVFAYSLTTRQSMVEQLARITDPDLPDRAIPYTRKVTLVWCIFFVINALIATYTAVFTSLETWTLYNGLISYIIMGSIFTIEYLVRIQVKKKAEQ